MITIPFHARYANDRARVALNGTALAGHLPRRAARLVRKWAQLKEWDLSNAF